MRIPFKYLRLSALFYFLCVSIFFIYIEHFPIIRFVFNFILLLAVTLSLFLVLKKKYTSLVLACSLLAFVIFASIIKQLHIGSYLYFSDVIFFFQNPMFILDFVSIPILIILFSVWSFYIVLLYKNEPKSKFKFVHLLVLICACGLVSNRISIYEKQLSWVRRSKAEALQVFVASTLSKSFNALKLPPPKANNATCCHVIKKDDIAITTSNPENKPNIVFILLESTFNLSSLPDLGLTDQWKEFNQKPLHVYTAGGATWTAEYAIMHGVDPTLYGPDYQRINLAGPGVLKGRIAPSLKDLGYHTYSMLPHKRDFANSDNFHRSLGIDNVHDCKTNDSCKTVGTEAMDVMMFDHVFELLQKEPDSAFIFALTKHQHSPHPFSGLNPMIKCDGFSHRGCEVLQTYKNRETLVQLRINQFVSKLNTLPKETIVIFFGDHIPADVFLNIDESKFLNNDQFKTVAFGYSNRTQKFFDLHSIIADKNGKCNPNFELRVENLDILPLYMAGMRSKYISQKFEKLRNQCNATVNSLITNNS